MAAAMRFLAILAIALLVGLAASLTTGAQTREIAMKDDIVESFLAAAKTNDTERLKRALDAGVPVDSANTNGATALLIATHANAVAAARLLIKAGANVDTKDALQDSAFLYAGAEGRLEILKMTVAAGADLASVNRYGGTALIPAAHHGHVDVVAYLLTTRIDIDQVNFLGWTAMLEAVILGDGGPVYQRIVQLLLDAGADQSIADGDGATPLDHAKTRGQLEIARLLQEAMRR
jgi:ankyrin repeat protein